MGTMLVPAGQQVCGSFIRKGVSSVAFCIDPPNKEKKADFTDKVI